MHQHCSLCFESGHNRRSCEECIICGEYGHDDEQCPLFYSALREYELNNSDQHSKICREIPNEHVHNGYVIDYIVVLHLLISVYLWFY